MGKCYYITEESGKEFKRLDKGQRGCQSHPGQPGLGENDRTQKKKKTRISCSIICGWDF